MKLECLTIRLSRRKLTLLLLFLTIWENWYVVTYTGLSRTFYFWFVGFEIWVSSRIPMAWILHLSILSRVKRFSVHAVNKHLTIRPRFNMRDWFCISMLVWIEIFWFLIFYEPGTNSLWMKNVISEQGGGRFRAGGPQCYAKWTISCSAHGMIFYITSDNCSNCSVHADWVVNLTFLCALEFWTTGMNFVKEKYFKSLTMGLATLGVYWEEWQTNFALRDCNSK